MFKKTSIRTNFFLLPVGYGQQNFANLKKKKLTKDKLTSGMRSRSVMVLQLLPGSHA